MKSHPIDFAVDGPATTGSEDTPSFLTRTALATLKVLASLKVLTEILLQDKSYSTFLSRSLLRSAIGIDVSQNAHLLSPLVLMEGVGKITSRKRQGDGSWGTELMGLGDY